MPTPLPVAAPPVYAGLTPTRVLDLLDAAGLEGDGRILQLNSYENRVYQVHLEDGTAVVAKFYRPARWTDAQILEEHAFALELAAEDIPVVAPLTLARGTRDGFGIDLLGDPATLASSPASEGSDEIDALGAQRYAVAPRRAGRAPELEDPATLERIGRFIGRLHAVGARRPFAHRHTLSVALLGTQSRDSLVGLDADVLPPDALQGWTAACDQALATVQRVFDAVGTPRTLRLHGDCHPGNLLWREDGPHFVDLDDACNGPAIQDLWMLLSGDEHAQRAQFAHVMAGYTTFMDFDFRERRLIEPLRTLRMIHHSAWIARRWSDPAFPIAFPWFAGSAYWQQQATQLREQVQTMEAASGD